MRPPVRPSFYILVLLVALLLGVVVYIYNLLSSPELQSAAARKKHGEPIISLDKKIPAGSAPTTAPVDPINAARASQLNAPERTPQEDLQVVSEFLELYRKVNGGNPTGTNEDITAAITGTINPAQSARLFPSDSNAIREGQLTDRWGTPYWFHPNSSSQTEIRSAGPDRQLFTPDDVVLNPSPSGLGATPETPPVQ